MPGAGLRIPAAKALETRAGSATMERNFISARGLGWVRT
jgi:hypothetical protein